MLYALTAFVCLVLSNILFAVLGYLAGKGELQNGVVPAIKRSIGGARGAVLTDEPTPDEKKELKKQFMEKAKINPLTKLPNGLNPEDFE